MRRESTSHKGENGKVAVIGGSFFIHGAPLLSALAAEASGVDLVYVCLPEKHRQVAACTSLNFQVHPFHGNELASEDVDVILELLASMDAAVIGPGISRTPSSLATLSTILSAASCPLIADAGALQSFTLNVLRGRRAVVTPHLGELERMSIAPQDISQHARTSGIVFHLKGSVDRIASPDGDIREISGGNPGLTVGGTGDALAGLIAGFIAQGDEPVDACVRASTLLKNAGDMLHEERGYAFTARQVIEHIPSLLRSAWTDE